MFKRLFFFLVTTYIFAADVITPIPLTLPYDEEKAALGKKLFFDKILSNDGTLSCSSCHILPGSGADKQVYSVGINGQATSRNTPTVLNAVFNFAQFWDGRAKDLHEQALMPIFNPKELGSSLEAAIIRLENSSYKEKFERIFEDGITRDTIAEVLVEFEKVLITPNSRFDKYLLGDTSILNEQEMRGYETFKSIGCISCHNGVNMGGNMYQKVGIMVPFDHLKDDISFNGRYNITHRIRDKAVFKVPTLRNIELTAPYLHDGSARTLKDAVLDMREHQLGIVNEDSSVDDLVAFLKTLTGESPKILGEK